MSKPLIGDTIDPNDVYIIGVARVKQIGLTPHLPSANHFYNSGVRQIITQGFTLKKEFRTRRENSEEDKDIDKISILIKFTDVRMKAPTTMRYQTGKEVILTPREAHDKDKNYSSSLEVSMFITATAYLLDGNTRVRTAEVKNIQLCKIPTMVRSVNCHTYKKSADALMKMRENPYDPGGYFILKGVEWAIDGIENILFNQAKIYNNIGYNKSLARLEYISKPGDTYQNSDLMLLRYFKNKTLTVEISRDKLSQTQLPFYIIMAVLGFSTDRQIMESITYTMDEENKEMIQIVKEMIQAKYDIKESRVYDRQSALRYIVNALPEEKFRYLKLNKALHDKEVNEDYKKAISRVSDIIDTHFLPHIGMLPEHRHTKGRFLGHLIRNLILTHLGVISPTDRDSHKYKRISAAGGNLAKAFKTLFNVQVISTIKKRFEKAFNASPFSQVDLSLTVNSAINIEDFEKSVSQVITSAKKSAVRIRNQQIVNRLSSQPMHLKNSLNSLATLRQIVSTAGENSKQSERAHEMRRIHPTFLGFYCLVHSPEGEKVGLNKQLAMFASISRSTSSEVLKQLLLEDTKCIIPLDKVSPRDIVRKKLSNVFVNGYWLGLTKNTMELAKKYRNFRRHLKMDPETTIAWDPERDSINFWVDSGRMLRPLMIVYNTKRDPEMFSGEKKFRQGLALTQAHIDGLYKETISIDDLLKERIIEYVSPEEQMNYLLCDCIEELTRQKNNELLEYTHCDIPEGLFGITGGTSPCSHMNQTPRVTFQTSQAKQTCGIYTLNWAHRIDKNTFLQYVCEQPLVRTVSNNFVFPNGCNVLVAIACYLGYNQEDSLICNKAASERGLFNGCKFTFYKTEIEQKEELGNPDATRTRGLKSSCYDQLVKGVITRGSIVTKGTVLIGKYLKLPKGKDNKYLYEDKSIIYKENEPAIVHRTIIDHNEDDELICKVSLRKIRPIEVGDKFSSRAGQKGVIALKMRESDMPTTADGIRPAIILNPHALPSRMTIGQIVESLLAGLCTIKGSSADGTVFRKIDIEAIISELESRGFKNNGYKKLYNGMTGKVMDSLIFMGPTYYQRLQKFVKDTVYGNTHGPTDVLTNQPLDGKSCGGGLKMGEMEKDVVIARGLSKVLREKFTNHSDGRTQYMCKCGKQAIVNFKEKKYICHHCGDTASIYALATTYSSKLVRQEMESCGVGLRVFPKPNQKWVYEE